MQRNWLRIRHRFNINWLLVAGMAAWFVFHLFSLARYPVPTCDEGQYGSVAYQFLQHGNFGLPIMNNLFGLDRTMSLFGRFYLLALAGSFAIFGTGLFQARLLSLLGVVAVVLVAYSTGKRLYDRRAGFIAALLVALSWDVLARGHLVRPEIWLAASEAAVLGFFWNVSEAPTFKRGLLFGFAATLPMSIHPNGFLFLMGFGVLCLLEFGLRARQPATLMATGVGAAAGGLLWLALHFLPDIALAYGQWVSFGRQLPVGVSVWWLLGNQAEWLVESYWSAYGHGAALQSAYFVAAIGIALWRRGRANVSVLLLTTVSMLSFTFLKVGKQPPTSVLWIPLLAILLAGNLSPVVNVLEQRLSLPRYWIPWECLVILPLLLAYAAGDAWLAWRYRDLNYQQQIAAFEQVIPPGTRFAAEATWWYGLGPHNSTFLDDAYFENLSLSRDGGLSQPDIAAEFDTLGLDYVILDEGLGCTTGSATSETFAAYVTEECRPISRLETPYYASPKENIVYWCSE